MRTEIEIAARQTGDAAFKEVQKNLEDLKNAAVNVAAGISVAFGAALSFEGIKEGLTAVVNAAIEAEKAESKIIATLRATESAAGLTKKELFEMADALAASTNFDRAGLKDAIGILLSFKNIGRESFERTLKAGTDLATLFDGDLKSSVEALGRALDNPVEGMNRLRRAHISLSQEQKELIKNFEESGQHLKAQDVILGAIESRLGGAAGAANSGLTKATRDASKAWNELLEALGRTSTVKSAVEGTLDLFTGALEGAKRLVTGPSRDERLARLAAERDAAFRAANDENLNREKPEFAARILARAQALQTQIDALHELNRAENEVFLNEQKIAAAGEKKQGAEREAEAAAARLIVLKKKREELLGTISPFAENEKELTLYREMLAKKVISFDEYADAVIESDIKLNKRLDEIDDVQKDKHIEQRKHLLIELQKATGEAQAGIIKDEREQALARVEVTRKEFQEKIELAHAEGEERRQLETALNDFVVAARNKAIEDTKSAGAKLLDDWRNTTRQLGNASANWLNDLAGGLTDFVLTGKADFRSFAESIIRDLVRIKIQAGLSGIFSLLNAGTASAPLAADLPAEAAAGGFIPFAKGGNFWTGQNMLVGESGPELITARANGSVIPMGSGAGGIVIHQVNNFQGGVTQQDLARMMPEIQKNTMAAVAQGMQRGGPFAAAFRS